MAEYLPLYLPGRAFTSQSSAAVTGGQLVYVSGSGTVANTTSAANIAIGVAGFDVPTGTNVEVFGRGPVHRLTASGTVTAGDVVEAAANGAVATHTQGTNDIRSFGIALTTATNGNVVEIMEL